MSIAETLEYEIPDPLSHHLRLYELAFRQEINKLPLSDEVKKSKRAEKIYWSFRNATNRKKINACFEMFQDDEDEFIPPSFRKRARMDRDEDELQTLKSRASLLTQIEELINTVIDNVDDYAKLAIASKELLDDARAIQVQYFFRFLHL